MSRPARAPGGGAPPDSATLPDGSFLELAPLAREIAGRHRREFPDEAERYGDRGLEWCTYDNQWLLSWAIMAAGGWGTSMPNSPGSRTYSRAAVIPWTGSLATSR